MNHNEGRQKGDRTEQDVVWGTLDEFVLSKTGDKEIRLWKKVKLLYDCTPLDLIPRGSQVDTSENEALAQPSGQLIANTNWSERFCDQVHEYIILSCV